jgi:hypothetical protein
MRFLSRAQKLKYYDDCDKSPIAEFIAVGLRISMNLTFENSNRVGSPLNFIAVNVQWLSMAKFKNLQFLNIDIIKDYTIRYS